MPNASQSCKTLRSEFGHGTLRVKEVGAKWSTYPRKFLDIVGVQIQFLQGFIIFVDLLRYEDETAVSEVQGSDNVLLQTDAEARHSCRLLRGHLTMGRKLVTEEKETN